MNWLIWWALWILVYLAMGGLAFLTALNYSVLGAAIPIAGGGYSFASRTLPKPISFLRMVPLDRQ